MKTFIRPASFVLVATTVAFGLAACAEPVYHKEETKPGWFGGTTHKEETTYKNPDGTYSTVKEKQTVK